MLPLDNSLHDLLVQLGSGKHSRDLDYAACLTEFIRSPAASAIPGPTIICFNNALGRMAKLIGSAVWPWPEEYRRTAEFFARVFQNRIAARAPLYSEPYPALLGEVLGAESSLGSDGGEWLWLQADRIGIDASSRLQAMERGMRYSVFKRYDPRAGEAAPLNTWERRFLEFPDHELIGLIPAYDCPQLIRALVVERRTLIRSWGSKVTGAATLANMSAGCVSALVTPDGALFDVVEAYQASGAPSPNRAMVLLEVGASSATTAVELFKRYAPDPGLALEQGVLDRLLEIAPDEARGVALSVLSAPAFSIDGFAAVLAFGRVLDDAAGRIPCIASEAIFDRVVFLAVPELTVRAISALVSTEATDAPAQMPVLVRRLLATLEDGASRQSALEKMAIHTARYFEEEWISLLASPSKVLRELAAEALCEANVVTALTQGLKQLGAEQADARLGAVKLLGLLASEESLRALRDAFVTEKSKIVRSEIGVMLRDHGGVPSEEGEVDKDVWTAFLTNAAKMKCPARPRATWLQVDSLPTIFSICGRKLESTLVGKILATQAAQKNPVPTSRIVISETAEGVLVYASSPPVRAPALAPAPQISALLAQVDRARSGDFALALLQAWLASPQDAKDRWALAIAGALGDTRILSVLNSWIPNWCETSRGKLAEYAAQAIALQGSDEALMLLDALATRYRSKQRNIGAAAAQAFQAAAEARGLSPDELGDVVVPAFGFDAEGVRDFTWEGGAARAELGVELKLSWSDPETDKTLKGLPASAPDALKAEAKELGKLLREAAKGQAARLELALVRQRRWPVARWRELYETHPVLRAYATRLVWGVYGKTDTGDAVLLRCFRRYPNGLLADAAGGLEELPEADALIGMVHPLELSAETVSAWRVHLARFKVAPPFAQLDRPVERLDALHANRRELAVAKDRALGAGTFRSRAERRGWVRGSVVDAGMVAGYFKAFPGAGVEVTLEIEGLFVGIDPMDTVTLGVARFVRADSVKRGSYTYDDPQAGDARVLPFGDVPPVVYSETVGDLKFIAGIGAATADAEGDEA